MREMLISIEGTVSNPCQALEMVYKSDNTTLHAPLHNTTQHTSSTRKRKSDKISARSENPKCPSCIVHAIDIRDYGPLTSLRNVRGNPDEKFAYLHEIRENRMAEPLNSPRRMEEVCAQIPETLEGVDLEMIGYHRPCYQRFTANLHRLNSTVASMSTKHHSPRKLSSAESSQLFPPECMFCKKFEKRYLEKPRDPSNSYHGNTKSLLGKASSPRPLNWERLVYTDR
ncbi:hypothetical protein GWK47_036657 [Chionoecetes opilio]|uniref:Uncharacterized protein n=1 Tax=Chionoecetes opilio TaxID=41210 RepID=A0A8J4YMD2_CHIOP|nr:hypothetical protein GWK47_036657 [Chionoecetes opilio]